MRSRRICPASRTSSRPFTSSTPILRRPTVGRSRPNSTRAIAEPITARSTRCGASAPILAPRSSTIELAADGRPARRDRGPVDPGHGLELEFRERHHRAGIAGGDRKVRLAAFDRIDGHRHRRLPSALAQRLARLGVHRDRHVGMEDARGRLELRPRVEQRLDQGAVAEQQKLDARMPVERDLRPGNDHGRSEIAPHGVERNTNLIRHERP